METGTVKQQAPVLSPDGETWLAGAVWPEKYLGVRYPTYADVMRARFKEDRTVGIQVPVVLITRIGDKGSFYLKPDGFGCDGRPCTSLEQALDLGSAMLSGFLANYQT